MEITSNEVMNELKQIRIDINVIKDNLIENLSLDEGDKEALKDYEEEKERGELISHEELKKELDL